MCQRRAGCSGLVSYTLHLRSRPDLPSCLPPLAREAVRRSHRLAAARTTGQGRREGERESGEMHEHKMRRTITHTHTHTAQAPQAGLHAAGTLQQKDFTTHLLLPVLHRVDSSRWCSCSCCSVYALEGEGRLLLLPPAPVGGALVLLVAHASLAPRRYARCWCLADLYDLLSAACYSALS